MVGIEAQRTESFDVKSFMSRRVIESTRMRVGKRHEIKAQVLPLIHENEDLRRLDLEALDHREKLAELRRRTEEVVKALLPQFKVDELSSIEKSLLIKEILDEALGLGPLEDFLADGEVDEIMVNGPDRIFVERKGKISLTGKRFASIQQLYNVIERIVAPVGRRIDESTPYVDARLARDGSRVHIIIPPLALSGPTITIRKFTHAFTPDDLIALGAMTNETHIFLDSCVRGRKSIIVSGGTGTGKTTLLNVLSSSIPDDERIITIEDAAELQLKKTNLVTLEARRLNVEGKGEVSIRDLVRNALRMRPDRIVVGECRGGEAFDMLQAMNTGHEGSLTTIHANTPSDLLIRLESLVLMGTEMPIPVIRQNLSSAVDLIVQITRYRDGSRKISRIVEVADMQDDHIMLKELFVFQQTGLDENGKVTGSLKPTGIVPSFFEEFRIKGIPLDEAMFTETTSNLHKNK
ncbi:MAG: CpaF family protein [Verrucomicrobiae bacterium]|nr:CpaF family protein [Verrucomicrobiae bacterium]